MLGIRVTEEPGGAINPDAILIASDRESARNLEKSAAYIRKVAANSLKPAKQVPVSSLSEDQLKAYRIAQRRFKEGESNKKPERPTQPSRPGEPPRMQRPNKLLKVFLLFAKDPATGRWVIGSARLPRKGLAPKTLEQGGMTHIGRKSINVEPRPYMVPAMHKEQAQMAKRWENSIK